MHEKSRVNRYRSVDAERLFATKSAFNETLERRRWRNVSPLEI